ncbi:alkaline phosphatase [Zalerion maritima]|uniref:Alkaline phosphatase n=1 Tax=Zalerion maritima TaxID=339359 RepID=A0AAD5RRD0_9PEZI|nr:alkaline phosphatase [Zalerion maritima]
MVRPIFLTSVLLGWSLATATFTGNLNYMSPSAHHPGLGISIRKVAARTYASSPWDPSELSFTHGVASGDPTSNSVILWARAAPYMDNDRSNVTVSGYVDLYSHETDEYVVSSKAPVCVGWKIGKGASSGTGIGDVTDDGTAYTSSDVDFTIKVRGGLAFSKTRGRYDELKHLTDTKLKIWQVEAKNLEPFTTYYYQFSICDSDNTSPIGRTKTIPEKGASVNTTVKLAVYSCSNYPFGFFNAYGNPVRKDSVDYVVHLGDYIYEYANGHYGWGNSFDRIPLPDRDIVSLYDYRKRYATYRTDLDLLASHEQFPWIPVWDDHEVADNVWKSGMASMNNTEDSFIEDGGISVDQRKMNAVRAYFEWMPIRQVDMDDNLRIWRSFAFGDLFDLIMLDTRNYDRGITDVYWNTEYIHEIKDEASRTLMGPRQESWFYHALQKSAQRGAAWRLVGNQVIFSRMNVSISVGSDIVYNHDQFDGYTANRNRTLNTLYENEIGNNIFLAGDSHAAWVSDLVWLGEKEYDSETGEGAIGVEFAGSAVSSPSPAGQNISLLTANAYSSYLQTANDELQWQDLYYRGYFEPSIGYDDVNASFFGLPTSATRNGYEIPLANFTVLAGENRLHRTPDGIAAVGGVVESGSLYGGEVLGSMVALDTETGEWFEYSG